MRITLLVAALSLLQLAPKLAWAADRNVTLSGTALSIDHPCARHAAIVPDPALQDSIIVSAHADHQEELDALVFDPGHIHTTPSGCWQPAGIFRSFNPTLDLEIRVPPGMSLAIAESGAPIYDIGGVGGSLSLDLSGSVRLTAPQATSLVLQSSGDDTVHIGSVSGATKISSSGTSHITLDKVTTSLLQMDFSGAGGLSVGSGQIGNVSVQDSGAGQMDIRATVDTATVQLSGAGHVRFARVTGALRKDVSGAATVSVGE